VRGEPDETGGEDAQRDRRVQRGQVRVCDPVPAGNGRYGDDYYGDGRVSGYDVTYEYGNRTYHTRTDHHPGDLGPELGRGDGDDGLVRGDHALGAGGLQNQFPQRGQGGDDHVRAGTQDQEA